MPSLFIDETGNFADVGCNVAMVGVLLPDDGLRGNPQFVRQALRMAVRSVPEPFHARFMYKPAYYAVCLAHTPQRLHRASLDTLAVALGQADLELGEAAQAELAALAAGQEGSELEPGDADFLVAMTAGPRNRQAIQGAAVGTRFGHAVDPDVQRCADMLLRHWGRVRRIDLDAVTRAIDAGQEPADGSLAALERSARSAMPTEFSRIDDAIRQSRASVSAVLTMLLPTGGTIRGCAWYASGETRMQATAASERTSFDRWRSHLVVLLQRVAAATQLSNLGAVDVHVLCPDSLAHTARALQTAPTAMVKGVLDEVDPEILQLAAVANWQVAATDARYVLADLAAMHSRLGLFQRGNWADARTLLGADGIFATEIHPVDRVNQGLPLAAAVGRAHDWLSKDAILRGQPPVGQSDRVWAWEQAVAWSEASR